jgi:putative membrane protein
LKKIGNLKTEGGKQTEGGNFQPITIKSDYMGNEQQIKSNAENDDPRIEVAIERTQLAFERTQLAWIRTVLALITAGLAIDKGTEALHQARIAMGEALVKDGHVAGMLLTISGTVMMIIVTVISFRRIKELDQMNRNRRHLHYPVFVLSFVICFFGVIVIWFLSKV